MRRMPIASFVGLSLLASAVIAAQAEGAPAPVASSLGPTPDSGPSVKADAPKSDTPAEVVAPEVEAALEPRKADEPSQERRAILKKVSRVRQARAARGQANLRWRQAAYAQMIWLAQQNSSGGATESSSCSSSSCSSSTCSSSGSSQGSTSQCPSPSFPVSAYTPSQPQPAPVPGRSLTGEILDAHKKMAQRYP